MSLRKRIGTKVTLNARRDWEERFYTPPPPGSHFRDCDCARIEAKVVYTPPPPGGGRAQNLSSEWSSILVYCIIALLHSLLTIIIIIIIIMIIIAITSIIITSMLVSIHICIYIYIYSLRRQRGVRKLHHHLDPEVEDDDLGVASLLNDSPGTWEFHPSKSRSC